MPWSPLSPIPTDTYYKFKAMAGIWLVVGAVVGASLAFFKFESEAFEVRMRAAALLAEARFVQTKIDDDKQLIRRTEDLIAKQKLELQSARRDLDAIQDSMRRGADSNGCANLTVSWTQQSCA